MDELRQVHPRHQLHRVPLQPRPAADVVDADDARVAESARELSLAPEPLHDRRISRQRRMEHLHRDVPLEPQVARAIHATETACSDLLEQLVVVAERAPEAPLEPGLRHLRCRRRLLKHAGVAHEILEHLGRRVVAAARRGLKRAQQHPLQRRRYRGPQLARWRDARRIEIRLLTRQDVVDEGGHAVHIAPGLAGTSGSHLRRDEGTARTLFLWWHIRETPVAVAEVRDHRPARELEHERQRDDPTQNHAARVGVLGGAEQVAHQRVRRANRARPPAQRLGKAFSLDPVRGAVCERAHHAGGVNVANRRMVEGRQRLRLAQEPGAPRGVGRQVHVQRDGAFQHPVPRVVHGALGGGGHPLVQTERRGQCPDDVVQQVGRRGRVAHRVAQSNRVNGAGPAPSPSPRRLTRVHGSARPTARRGRHRCSNPPPQQATARIAQWPGPAR